MNYVELHARSAFSFLRGASTPEQLAERAAALDLPAIAVCDRNGVYGSARLFGKANEVGIKAIVGAELVMEDSSVLPVLVESRTGYQNLCQLLTQAHLRSEKGKARVLWEELPEFAAGLIALTGDEEGPLRRALRKTFNIEHSTFNAQESPLSRSLNVRSSMLNVECSLGNRESAPAILQKLFRIFGRDHLYVELQRHRLRGEDRVVRDLVELSQQFHLPLVATNGVLHMSEAERPILDVFTCIRNHTHLDAAGRLLAQNGERHLKTAAQMAALFRDHPEAIENTVRLSQRLDFTLENLGYEFPAYSVPPEHTMDSFLREKAFEGARSRYKHLGEIPGKVRRQIETELALIAKLKVAGYFLIVWDIVQFCREQNIMAQGRGSAANSTVCYCLGITAVDPLRFETLFERFLTEGRKHSWPDIDIDLPSGDRRERVLQEIYQRYGKRGAAMTANVITFRGRSSAREVGKALNLSGDVLNRFSNLYANGDFPHTLDLPTQMERAGLPKDHPRALAFAALCKLISGLPRHLGQHSGGMIIFQGKLDSVVPLENASMPNRVVAQWDKDDCEDLGIIKVDFLGLGMMSVLQDTVELTRRLGREVDLAQLPQDDKETFAMMQKADTVGVFQIESRAQMATLPRMKPKNFYDVVIEVAIIRPGPIQGHLMHPYLDRRKQVANGADPNSFSCYHESLRSVLGRTLGVPLFQEQMLQIAMVMADFSGAEAEELRRALSFHRSQERMQKVEGKLRAAMERKNVPANTIEEIVKAVGSFALYGFPESHAISFAHLAYASAYLKVHRAPEFYASLLNNQPMGFYSSASLVKDGQRHGVKFLPVCVMKSEWDCAIESEQGKTTNNEHRTSNAEVLAESQAEGSNETLTPALSHLTGEGEADPAFGLNANAWGVSQRGKEQPSPRGEGRVRGTDALLSPDHSREGSKLNDEKTSNVEHRTLNAEVLASQLPSELPIRLGLRVVRGLSHSSAEKLLAERRRAPFASLDDCKRRVQLSKEEWRILAEVGALNCFAAHRRDALWEVEKELRQGDLFEDWRKNALTPALSRRTGEGEADPSVEREVNHRMFSTVEKEEPSPWGEGRVRGADALLSPDHSREGSESNDEPRTSNSEVSRESMGLHEAFTPVERGADPAFCAESSRKVDSPSSKSPLRLMDYSERIRSDYRAMHLTTGKHPMALLRARLKGVWRAGDLPKVKHGTRIRIAGNVICRQRPGTAKGFVFISLEDETGISNAIVTPPMFEANRLLITEESFLIIEGILQNVDNVIHVKSERIQRLDVDRAVASASYDFH